MGCLGKVLAAGKRTAPNVVVAVVRVDNLCCRVGVPDTPARHYRGKAEASVGSGGGRWAGDQWQAPLTDRLPGSRPAQQSPPPPPPTPTTASPQSAKIIIAGRGGKTAAASPSSIPQVREERKGHLTSSRKPCCTGLAARHMQLSTYQQRLAHSSKYSPKSDQIHAIDFFCLEVAY